MAASMMRTVGVHTGLARLETANYGQLLDAGYRSIRQSKN